MYKLGELQNSTDQTHCLQFETAFLVLNDYKWVKFEHMMTQQVINFGCNSTTRNLDFENWVMGCSNALFQKKIDFQAKKRFIDNSITI